VEDTGMKTFRLVCAFGALLAGHPASLEAQGNPDLTVTLAKAGAQPEVPTRTNVAFVATISNIASVQATSVLTRVTMPAGFTNLSTTPAPGSGITCSVSGVTVDCTASTMPGNSQKTFRISSTAPATITGQSQEFTLTAVADPANAIAEGPGGNANNSDNFTVRIATRADLTVSLTGPPGTILTTQVAPDLVYLVTARNSGDRAASNLLVRATLPKDVEFVRVQDNTLGSCLQNSTASNGALNINCTLSSLAAGATGRVRILGKVTGSVPDRVQVTFAANVDPNNSVPERNDTDNTAFMVTTLRARADVQITRRSVIMSQDGGLNFAIEQPGDFVCARGESVVQVDVKNNGPYQSPATAVTTTWPAGFTAPSSGCFDRCNVPALTPGQTVRLTLRGRIAAAFNTLAQPTFVLDPDQTVFDPIVGNNRVTITACGGV
jgi:uncharacterized repeat protein (TIGR01451 family)